jgi:signal transduction histidine kinase
LVHDSFAEEVSLIHQVLINPSVNDLVPLKEEVRSGLESFEKNYSNLAEMERFYGLLGVHFFESGDFERCPDKVSVLSLIREATDNAIRHGNANEIHLLSSLSEGCYHLLITNNGSDPVRATPHNGLAHLISLFESKGGSLKLSLKPQFALEATLPLPKG